MVSIKVQRNVFEPFNELEWILSRPLPYHLKVLKGDIVLTWIIFVQNLSIISSQVLMDPGLRVVYHV